MRKSKSEQHESLQRTLQYRAWAVHSTLTIFRVYNMVAGTTTWFDYPDPPCLKMLKEDLTDAA